VIDRVFLQVSGGASALNSWRGQELDTVAGATVERRVVQQRRWKGNGEIQKQKTESARGRGCDKVSFGVVGLLTRSMFPDPCQHPAQMRANVTGCG